MTVFLGAQSSEIGLPYILFPPDTSSSSIQKFLSGQVFKFVKTSSFLTICYFLFLNQPTNQPTK